MTEQDLLKLKNDIAAAKTQLAEIQGRKKGLLSQLKDTYECDTIDEAEKKVEILKEKIEDNKKEIQVLIDKIEDTYPL